MNRLHNIFLQLGGRHGQDVLDMAHYLSTHSDPDPEPKTHSVAADDVLSDPMLLEHLLKSANVSRNARNGTAKRASRAALLSSSAPQEIKFTLPSLPIVIFTLGGSAMLTYLALAQSENCFLLQWVFWVVPQYIIRFAAKTLLVVHGFETLVMMLACRSVRKRTGFVLDYSTMLLYAMSTLVFGVFAGLAFVRSISRQ
ncbi:hypothetical protein IWW45_007412 [Coemansia sp. RSA 485]|nr:hypothetical protein IWW45_007412 [Coemansia sp. RSA 485]